MGDGFNQDTTNQICTTCGEQDKITIAGKIFCANCGTPQTDGAATSAAQSTTSQPAASVSPSLSIGHNDNQSNSVSVTPSASTAVVTPADKMPAQASTPPTTASDANSSSEQVEVKSQDPIAQIDSAMSTAMSPSISKYNAPSPANTADTAPKAEAADAPGNEEITSLDDKSSESVMSDETLNELAKTTTEATDAIDEAPVVSSSYKLDLTQAQASSLPKAVSDIRPAAKPMASATPAAPAPVAAPAVALQSPVSVPPVQAAIPSQTSAAPVAPTAISPSSAPTTAPSQPPVVPAAASSPLANPVQPAVSSVMDSTAAAAAQADKTSSGKGLKASSVALSLVGLLVIGGYIWQVNYPNLALKMAGSKAGISANFPGYVPSGWKLTGAVQSSPGSISYNIADSKTNKSIQISESKTNWDSQALAENYIAPKSDNYLALQSQGLTIYVYDGNQASWVNNGTWYRIEGSSHGLSQDQIIKLATSL